MKDFITPDERVTAASRITGSPLSKTLGAVIAAPSFLLAVHSFSELWSGFFFLVAFLCAGYLWVESDNRALGKKFSRFSYVNERQ